MHTVVDKHNIGKEHLATTHSASTAFGNRSDHIFPSAACHEPGTFLPFSTGGQRLDNPAQIPLAIPQPRNAHPLRWLGILRMPLLFHTVVSCLIAYALIDLEAAPYLRRINLVQVRVVNASSDFTSGSETVLRNDGAEYCDTWYTANIQIQAGWPSDCSSQENVILPRPVIPL